MNQIITPKKNIHATITVPGDKSISHCQNVSQK